jgi:hypothetical protein
VKVICSNLFTICSKLQALEHGVSSKARKFSSQYDTDNVKEVMIYGISSQSFKHPGLMRQDLNTIDLFQSVLKLVASESLSVLVFSSHYAFLDPLSLNIIAAIRTNRRKEKC